MQRGLGYYIPRRICAFLQPIPTALSGSQGMVGAGVAAVYVWHRVGLFWSTELVYRDSHLLQLIQNSQEAACAWVCLPCPPEPWLACGPWGCLGEDCGGADLCRCWDSCLAMQESPGDRGNSIKCRQLEKKSPSPLSHTQTFQTVMVHLFVPTRSLRNSACASHIFSSTC